MDTQRALALVRACFAPARENPAARVFVPALAVVVAAIIKLRSKKTAGADGGAADDVAAKKAPPLARVWQMVWPTAWFQGGDAGAGSFEIASLIGFSFARVGIEFLTLKALQ